MPTFDFTSPEGKTYSIDGPEGSTKEQAFQMLQTHLGSAKPAPQKPSKPYMPADLMRDVGAGALRGAGSIGSTIMRVLPNALGGDTAAENEQRRARLDENARNLLGADTDSIAYSGGKLAGEIAGTAGAGGVLGNALGRGAQLMGGARAAQAVNPMVAALRSSGMTTGAKLAPDAAWMGAKGADLALRSAAGGAVGGASTALTGSDDVGMGAGIGAALPGALKAAGGAGSFIGGKVKNAFSVSDEVGQLAARAKELGIDIPADRLANSKPLNAIAASLNYVPMSGRAATEEKMISQLNQAVSKTFGQDSSNVTMALRKASGDLGGKFDQTLKSTGLSVDKQFMDDIAAVYNKAESELGSEGLKPISSKINDLMQKAETGVVDGQAAYNIKRDLDRIGRSNNPNAFHALELKGALMDALNRSLGPEKAAAFAQTRQQYGNMLALEKLAKNGVDGEISAARLANMKNINNEPLQELADIAAQFVKGREGQHGAMQRVMVGGVGASMGLPALPAMAAGVGTARLTNSALNSNMLKNAMLGNGGNKMQALLESPEGNRLMQSLAKSAPVAIAQ